MKRVISVLLLFTFLKEGFTQSEFFVLKTESNPFYDGVLTAFERWCECSLKVYDMQGKIEAGRELIKKERDRIKNMVVAVGTLAMRAIHEGLPEKNILCLLCMDPEYLDIPSYKVSGVSVFFDTAEVSKAIAEMLPEIKRGAILVSEKMVQVGEEMRSILKFDLLISKNPMDSLQKISEREFEIIYFLPDPQTLNPTVYQTIVKLSKKKDFIIVAPSPAYLKIGGHMAFTPDLERAGKEGARIMKDALSGGKGRFIRCPTNEVVINERAMASKSYKTPKGFKVKITTEKEM